MKKDRVKCKAKVRQKQNFARYSRCEHWASKDGYCAQHHPDNIEARRQKEREEWERLHRLGARDHLAKCIGLVVLNRLERGGRMHIEDYSKVTVEWVLSMYDPKEKT